MGPDAFAGVRILTSFPEKNAIIVIPPEYLYQLPNKDRQSVLAVWGYNKRLMITLLVLVQRDLT